MNKKPYEFIEHTADVGIRVTGKDLKDLFKNAALALFEIIAEKIPAKAAGKKSLSIKESSQNIEELFVNWLNDLLSLSAIHGVIFDHFSFRALTPHSLEAVVSGVDIKKYRVNTEVKAATYHGLKIEQTAGGWKAEVIFDV